MPTYSYRCTQCDNAFDIHQTFTDESLTECPICGGRLRKVFGTVGVSFTGTGFYRNDSRAAERSGAEKKDAGSSDAGTKDSSTSTDTKAAKPVASADGGSKSAPAPAASGSKPAAPSPTASAAKN